MCLLGSYRSGNLKAKKYSGNKFKRILRWCTARCSRLVDGGTGWVEEIIYASGVNLTESWDSVC